MYLLISHPRPVGAPALLPGSQKAPAFADVLQGRQRLLPGTERAPHPHSGPAECDRFFGPGALHSWPVPHGHLSRSLCLPPEVSEDNTMRGLRCCPCSGPRPSCPLFPSPLPVSFPLSAPFPPEPTAVVATKTKNAVLPVHWESHTVLESLAIFLPNIIVSTTGSGVPSAPGPSRVSGALRGNELVAASASGGGRF